MASYWGWQPYQRCSRRFEIQDVVRKSSKEELPDFYNIQLERPKDDPAGFDVLFIDAAAKARAPHQSRLAAAGHTERGLHWGVAWKRHCPLQKRFQFRQGDRCDRQVSAADSGRCCSLQGAFASRMSHSCTPNCQAVVMACNGRLTIAVYTLRYVQAGEELTFDYSSVTESEKEFRCPRLLLCAVHRMHEPHERGFPLSAEAAGSSINMSLLLVPGFAASARTIGVS